MVPPIITTLISSDERPDFLETIVIGISCLTWIIYFMYVIIFRHSRIFSFATLMITIGTVLILALIEASYHQRLWILVQYLLMIVIVAYLFGHRCAVHFNEK